MTDNLPHDLEPTPEDDAPSQGWIQPRRIYRVTAVRTGIRSDLQLLCGTGPFELNMLVRETDDPREVELSGRILRAGATPEPVPGIPVAVVDRDGSVLGKSEISDEYGEFRLTADTSTHCGLRLGEGPNAPCVDIRGDD